MKTKRSFWYDGVDSHNCVYFPSNCSPVPDHHSAFDRNDVRLYEQGVEFETFLTNRLRLLCLFFVKLTIYTQWQYWQEDESEYIAKHIPLPQFYPTTNPFDPTRGTSFRTNRDLDIYFIPGNISWKYILQLQYISQLADSDLSDRENPTYIN